MYKVHYLLKIYNYSEKMTYPYFNITELFIFGYRYILYSRYK